MIDDKSMEQKYTIVGTQILLEWNDSPKLVVCWNEMPDGLRQDWDDWLATIEYERNKAEAG